MFRNLTIRAKLLSGFLLMGVLVTAAGYIGSASTDRIARLLHTIVERDIARAQALLEMRNAASELAAQTISFSLLDEQTTQEEGTPAAAKKFELLATIEKLQKWQDAYRRHTQDEVQGLAFLQRVSSAQDRVVKAAVELIDLKERGTSNRRVDEKEQQLKAAQKDLQYVIAQALATESTALEERWKDARETAAKATQASLSVSLGAILLAFSLGVIIARVVSGPVIDLHNTAVQIAQGHLNKRVTVTSRDEVGQLGMAFNEMAGRIEHLIEIVHRSQAESERAKEEAERANRAKSEFLSRMSHELRTPLNAVLGFAQLLEMNSLTPEDRESVEHILKAGRHLLALINEVLDIARIEAGRLAISPEPVPLQEVVQESLALIVPLAAQRNIRLTSDPAPTHDGHILADHQRLKQVLLNLLTNAVKYNREGGIVTLSCEEIPQGRTRIKVSDTGPGIPPDMLERLFIPFERLSAAQTAVEGTGIGLALSKKLVELMGGTIGVESTVGQGSTFWVEFPVAEGQVERYKRIREDIPPSAGQAPAYTGTVLYIEDNLSNLKLIQHVLAHRPKVKLLSAMQGRLGLELAREHHPDLILLDWHLPDIAGEEILRRLRENPMTQATPVVVISADATSGHMERMLAAEARAHLTKPLDVEKLLGLLDETLKHQSARPAIPASTTSK